MEERYNQVRNSDYLEQSRENLQLYMIGGYVDQVCENLEANLDVGNLVNMYVEAIKAHLTHNTWQEFSRSSCNTGLKI